MGNAQYLQEIHATCGCGLRSTLTAKRGVRIRTTYYETEHDLQRPNQWRLHINPYGIRRNATCHGWHYSCESSHQIRMCAEQGTITEVPDWSVMATQAVLTGDQIAPPQFSEGNAGEETKRGQYTGRIALKARGRMLFLPVSNVCWIGAEENYVRICTGNESHLLRETMSSIEQRLDPNQFLRVHRSAIVNLRYVKELQSKTRGECIVHLVNGQKLPMSRSYRARVGALLNRCVKRFATVPTEAGVQ